jgi:hypothetical protein
MLTRILIKPEGVFLCYPVEDRFADHFASKRRQEKNSWRPWLIGFMWQEQSCSIVFAISASETELRAASTHNLVSLVDRIEALQKSLGTSRIAMAGILPSLLRASDCAILALNSRLPAELLPEQLKR